jgi:hypothetical protein
MILKAVSTWRVTFWAQIPGIPGIWIHFCQIHAPGGIMNYALVVFAQFRKLSTRETIIRRLQRERELT